MSDQAIGEDALETLWKAASPYTGAIKNLPAGSAIINGIEALYHFGAGGYDVVTGDRDGAVSHGAHGAMATLGMVPGVGPVINQADRILGPGGAFAKQYGASKGSKSLDKMPQSMGDLVAQNAVFATNALLGKDESNWFTGGTEPQGTRRGELGAGVSAVLGGPMAPFTADLNARFGNPIGEAFGWAIGTPVDAPTIGKRDLPGQSEGQWLHRFFGDLF